MFSSTTKMRQKKKLQHSFDVEFCQDSIFDGFGTFWAVLKAATSTYIFFLIHFFFSPSDFPTPCVNAVST